MSKLMRSISGIRGIVGDTLTPQVLKSHVSAFLQITKAKRVVIGRDSRPTGDAISQLAARKLPVPIEMVAVDDKFGESGKPDELMTLYGLDTEHIVDACKQAIARK